MTATSTALVNRKLASQRSREDAYRALDRLLARRYVEFIMHRNQIALDRQVRQGSLVYKPRLEICDDPSSSRVTATLEIPGMKSEDVRVHLEKNDTLLISGERRSPFPSDQETTVRYPTKEIKYGRFERVLSVPKGTLMSTISASMHDGLLILSWPRMPSGATASTNASNTSANDSRCSIKDEATTSA